MTNALKCHPKLYTGLLCDVPHNCRLANILAYLYRAALELVVQECFLLENSDNIREKPENDKDEDQGIDFFCIKSGELEKITIKLKRQLSVEQDTDTIVQPAPTKKKSTFKNQFLSKKSHVLNVKLLEMQICM